MVQVIIENWKKKQKQMQVPPKEIDRELAHISMLPAPSFSEWVLKNMQENLAPAIAR